MLPFSVKKKSVFWRVKCEKLNFRKSLLGNLMDKPSKIVHERNGNLKILSLPQGIENSRQFLLLRTDISQKTVVECPCIVPKVSISARELTVITNWSKSNAELFTQSIFHRRFYITCSTKKIKNKPEETSPRSFSGRKKRQNFKFMSEC